MAHFTTAIETPAAPSAAFSYLADFSNVERWDPTVSGASRLSDGPLGVGSRFAVTVSVPGRPMRFDYRISRYEPDRLLVLEAETDWLRSLDSIEIEPLESGCVVHYDADLRPRGLLYLLDLPIHAFFQLSGARSARGLERALRQLP